MNDTSRTIVIALGIALLVVILVPLLFMSSMMAGMMGRGWLWPMGGLILLLLVAGTVLLTLAVSRRS